VCVSVGSPGRGVLACIARVRRPSRRPVRGLTFAALLPKVYRYFARHGTRKAKTVPRHGDLPPFGQRQPKNRRHPGGCRRCRMREPRRSGRFPPLPYPPWRRPEYTPCAVGRNATNPHELRCAPKPARPVHFSEKSHICYVPLFPGLPPWAKKGAAPRLAPLRPRSPEWTETCVEQRGLTAPAKMLAGPSGLGWRCALRPDEFGSESLPPAPKGRSGLSRRREPRETRPPEQGEPRRGDRQLRPNPWVLQARRLFQEIPGWMLLQRHGRRAEHSGEDRDARDGPCGMRTPVCGFCGR